ncbi:hypothetical protein IGI37_003034 [Enterococcus sp. AZ194]|uniref:helix-turn-helix domain-containing protein n=1 Tax=Enterococcus sp. AZ194 TaxID=2774629 RepID=UPI003F22E672
MGHSSLVKRLRIERGYSQERLASGISKRSTLASFDNKATKISYDTLVQYLERLNITLEEYQFLLDNYKESEKKEISARFYQKLKQKYDKEFQGFLEHKYCETDNRYFELLKAVYLLVMSRIYPELGLEIESSKLVVSSYLDPIKTWGRFELSIFINTLFCFDSQYIQIHFRRSIKKMKGYTDSLYYSRDLLAFLMNGVQLAYERNEKKLFDEFFSELRFLADELNNMEANVVCKVFHFLSCSESRSQKEKYELFFVLEFLGKEDYILYIEEMLSNKKEE